MKTTLTVLGLLFCGLLLTAADFKELCAEGAKARKEKDYVSAEAKYGEALGIAKNSAEKCRALLGKFQAIRSQKKIAEAEKFALAAVEDESFGPQEVRQILNTVAGNMLWQSAKRRETALTLLQQAQNCPVPTTGNVYFQTYYYMGILYGKLDRQEAVIEVLDNVLKVRGQHPANLYRAHLMAGEACEKLGKKDEALNHYRAALENGKKVKYKFDFSPAEKGVERLSK